MYEGWSTVGNIDKALERSTFWHSNVKNFRDQNLANKRSAIFATSLIMRGNGINRETT
jgi:hypothetical protein